MSHDDLLHRLRTNAGFDTPEQAEHALTSTLETLGYLLPNPLVHELALALPRSCMFALQTALGSSDGARRLAHARAACIPSELPRSAVEEMQLVCGALFNILPFDLIRKLDAALPPPFTGLFTRYAASRARSAGALPVEEPSTEGDSRMASHDGFGFAPHAREAADK